MSSSEPPDLRRLIGQATQPQKAQGSGYAINMPDGKGGQNLVPVEIASVLLIDEIVKTLKGVLATMNGMLEAMQPKATTIVHNPPVVNNPPTTPPSLFKVPDPESQDESEPSS